MCLSSLWLFRNLLIKQKIGLYNLTLQFLKFFLCLLPKLNDFYLTDVEIFSEFKILIFQTGHKRNNLMFWIVHLQVDVTLE